MELTFWITAGWGIVVKLLERAFRADLEPLDYGSIMLVALVGNGVDEVVRMEQPTRCTPPLIVEDSPSCVPDFTPSPPTLEILWGEFFTDLVIDAVAGFVAAYVTALILRLRSGNGRD